MVGRETDMAICRCDVWAKPFVRTIFWPEGVKDDKFQFVAVFQGTDLGLLLDLIVQVLLSLLLLGRGAGALFRSRNGMKPTSPFLISKHISISTNSFT